MRNILTVVVLVLVCAFASAQTIQVLPGDTVTLTATPASGWSFTHWQVGPDPGGAYTVPDNPYVFVKADTEENVKAVFVQGAQLIITTEGEGAVSVEITPQVPGGDAEDFLGGSSPGSKP